MTSVTRQQQHPHHMGAQVPRSLIDTLICFVKWLLPLKDYAVSFLLIFWTLPTFPLSDGTKFSSLEIDALLFNLLNCEPVSFCLL